MTCRHCSHFDIEKTKDAAGRVRSNRVAPCLWVMPFKLPSSIRLGGEQLTPSWMAPDYGKNCPQFDKRKEKAE